MDANRFDTLAKLVGEPTSRRLALRSLRGGTLGVVLGLLGLAEVEAGDKKKKKNGGGGKKKKKNGGGGKKKNKKKDKKKQGCPQGWFECPDGTCVLSSSIGAPANAPTCCHGESCGPCGVCVNGRCTEVPGICDDANCERCNPVHWSCESRCGAGGTCCNGACQNPDLGPWQDCGDFCCPRDTTCCGSGISGICCTASSPVCAEPCGDLPHACCTPESLASGHCCGHPDGGGG